MKKNTAPASEQQPSQYDFSKEHSYKVRFVVVGIFTVSLWNGKQDYLRVLQHYVKGITSYKETKSVHEKMDATFRDACRQRGLLFEDE